jgi:hypothetical protein
MAHDGASGKLGVIPEYVALRWYGETHMGRVPTQNPAASSGEKLAAGVSLIRLQTKRLSGAQWRKLNREKKKKEGTWMERKHPSKAPKSGDRSEAGSSGV